MLLSKVMNTLNCTMIKNLKQPPLVTLMREWLTLVVLLVLLRLMPVSAVNFWVGWGPYDLA